jgi:hypothetical protein
MLDASLRKISGPALVPVAAYLARAKVPAAVLTVAGFATGLGAAAAIATHNDWWGLGLLAASRLLAGLDGSVARPAGAADLGAFLETVFGTIVAGSIPFAFALADPGRALAAAFLIFGFLASGSALLAFAATAHAVAMNDTASIRYPGGLIENTETYLALALACALPDWFSMIAYVLGALCFATAGMRIAEAAVRFR